jgi:hydrogenase maturation protease
VTRVLVAGIGNVFRGDDAFGVEVVRRLLARPRPDGIRVADFGTRGHDLAYAILAGYDVLILVDATARGGAPGALCALELDPTEVMRSAPAGGHGIDLPAAFRLVRELGGAFPRVRLVGCEPVELGSDDLGQMGLSAPVQSAVVRAAELVEELIAEVRAECRPCTNSV